MSLHRFQVYGAVYDIERTAQGWQVRAIGADGKRGDAGFVIPDFVTSDELGQFLADLFHEQAAFRRGGVVEVPHPAPRRD